MRLFAAQFWWKGTRTPIPDSLRSDVDRNTRLEVRLTREQKEKILRAARLSGRSITDFVVASAEQAADALIREREVIRLSAETSRVFAEALLNPPAPNDKLRAAVARYKDLGTDLTAP